MSDLFDDEDSFLISEDSFDDSSSTQEVNPFNARRRLENLLEEKKLKKELDDSFDDYY